MAGNSSPIGIFDSGVGGLTILSELQKLLPKESFIYVADQKYAPYGKKTKNQVKKRSLKITNFLQKQKCKIIIIACNTATISAIDYIRSKKNLPVIGVVPVIKTAAEITKNNRIAVFATPSTIKSVYLTKLIDKWAKNVTVYKNGATGLEELIESGIINSPKIDYILINTLDPLKKAGVDVIALGCTHYPFIKSAIQKVAGRNIKVIDSGGAVARHTKKILVAEKLLSREKGKDLYYTTGNNKRLRVVVEKLTGKKIDAKRIEL